MQVYLFVVQYEMQVHRLHTGGGSFWRGYLFFIGQFLFYLGRCQPEFKLLCPQRTQRNTNCFRYLNIGLSFSPQFLCQVKVYISGSHIAGASPFRMFSTAFAGRARPPSAPVEDIGAANVFLFANFSDISIHTVFAIVIQAALPPWRASTGPPKPRVRTGIRF